MKSLCSTKQFIIDASHDKTNCGMGRQFMKVERMADDPDCFKRAAQRARELKILYENFVIDESKNENLKND